MSDDPEILLLPFTIPSEKQGIPLDRKVELATIFCLAELGRDKGGGFISKRPSEEISFITKVYYPLWFVPWRRKSLIFDGLGIASHTISFDLLPDLGVFAREIRGSADNLEAYSTFLSHNMDYFKVVGEGQKVIKGLMVDQKLTEDLLSLLPEAKPIQDSPRDEVLLSPLMDRAAVEASIKELSNFKRSLREDIRSLQRIIKMLVEKTRKHIDNINRKIEETNKKYKNETASLKSRCMEKIERESREYSQKIAEVSKRTNRLIQDLSQEKLNLEMDRKHLTSYIERSKNEMEAAKSRGDKAEEEHWKKEIEKYRQGLLKVDKKIEEVNKSIEDAKSARDQEISRLKSEYASKIENIMVNLKKIEAARDFEIQTYQQTAKSLEESTLAIINQINKLVELRKLTLDKLERIAHPIGKRKYTIAYLPFFLVCYKRSLEKRYVVFPPSVAKTPSGILKIKGAFKSFRVRMLLQEYSTSITNLLNRFVGLIEQNLIFGDMIREKCAKMNMLKKFRKEIIEGLEELSKEKWLSEKEFAFLCEQGNIK